MFRMFGRLVIAPLLLAAGGSCSQIPTTTQMQHTQMDESRWAPRPYFTYMADNALLRDMTIADMHFIAHTAELSGTGIVRLDRLAKILATYGGTVRYETYSTDAEFIEKRIAHAREYLALAGCDMDRVSVKAMISGGLGLPADEAIEINDRGTEGSADSDTTGSQLLFAQPG